MLQLEIAANILLKILVQVLSMLLSKDLKNLTQDIKVITILNKEVQFIKVFIRLLF